MSNVGRSSQDIDSCALSVAKTKKDEDHVAQLGHSTAVIIVGIYYIYPFLSCGQPMYEFLALYPHHLIRAGSIAGIAALE